LFQVRKFAQNKKNCGLFVTAGCRKVICESKEIYHKGTEMFQKKHSLHNILIMMTMMIVVVVATTAGD